jgi:cysteine/O-acetylserine efflux protein
MGLLHGYRRTIRFLLGITTGVFLVALLCGLVSAFLLEALPGYETVVRAVGGLYILWLAYHTFRATYGTEAEEKRALGFPHGLLLQLLNVKLLVYGLTIYSAFLAAITSNLPLLVLSAAFLAAIAFCATSTWALFGSVIHTYLRQPKVRQAVNLVLSLLLVYAAVELSGIRSLIR